jgi:hypothetical protein
MSRKVGNFSFPELLVEYIAHVVQSPTVTTFTINEIWHTSDKNTRAIQKVTSGEVLTKQAMRKKLLYTKKYIHTFQRSQPCNGGIYHIGE